MIGKRSSDVPLPDLDGKVPRTASNPRRVSGPSAIARDLKPEPARCFRAAHDSCFCRDKAQKITLCPLCNQFIEIGSCIRRLSADGRWMHVDCPRPQKGDICTSIHLPNRFLEILEVDPGETALCNVFLPLEFTNLCEVGAKLLEKNGFEPMYAQIPGKETTSLSIRDMQKTSKCRADFLKTIVYEPKGETSRGDNWSYAYRSKEEPSKKVPICFLEQGPQVMSVFAGAGGTDLGFKMAGLQPTYAVEKDLWAVATLRRNYKYNKDLIVCHEEAREYLEKIKGNSSSVKYPKPGQLDVIHFSPPCQGHSTANPNRGSKEAAHNDLTLLCADYVEYLRPKAISFENVMGILDDKKIAGSRPSIEYFQLLKAMLLCLGYQFRVHNVNAMDYGDPQRRERVILVGVQNGFMLPQFEPPLMVHSLGGHIEPPMKQLVILSILSLLEIQARFRLVKCMLATTQRQGKRTKRSILLWNMLTHGNYKPWHMSHPPLCWHQGGLSTIAYLELLRHGNVQSFRVFPVIMCFLDPM